MHRWMRLCVALTVLASPTLWAACQSLALAKDPNATAFVVRGTLTSTVTVNDIVYSLSFPDGHVEFRNGAACPHTTTCQTAVQLSCLVPGDYRVRALGTCDSTPDPAGFVDHATINSDLLPFTVTDADPDVTATPGFDNHGQFQVSLHWVIPGNLPGMILPWALNADGTLRELFDANFTAEGTGDAIYHPTAPPGTKLIMRFFGCFGQNADKRLNVGPITIPTIEDDSQKKKYEMAAQIATPGAPASTFTTNVTGGTIEMHVPLGTVFRLGLRQKQTLGASTEVPATFTTISVDPLPPIPLTSSGTLVPKMRTLFGSRVLIGLDGPPSSNPTGSMPYMAVHYGTTTLRILPFSTAPSPLIHVTVVPPDQLGAPLNDQWTEYFANLAHNSGIPPQYLKAQAEQENNVALFRTSFSALNWRYEPCGVDIDQISGGPKLIDTADFKKFKLDDAIGVAITPHVQDELDPRSIFFIKRPNVDGNVVDRRITDDDRNVTAREIWDDNNKVTGGGHLKWNFDAGCAQKKKDQINDPATAGTALAFVAQTPTASSYGLFQVMWDEARTDEWEGTGADKTKHPKSLFDRLEYIAQKGGSGSLGCNLHLKHWIQKKKYPADPGSYASLDELERQLSKAIRYYNYSYFSDGLNYGQLVLDKSHHQAPRVPSSIFN